MFGNLLKLAEQMVQISDMDEDEKKRMKEIIENMSKLDDVNINSIEDVQKEVDFEFEEIDFDDMDDVEHLLDELDSLPIDDLVEQDVDFSKEGISDLFDHTSQFKYDPEPEEVDIDIDEDDIDEEPYQGDTWIEFEMGYETFVEVPEYVEDAEIDVTLEDDQVVVSEPIEESVDIDQLPDDVNSVEVDLKDENLVIRVR